MAHSVTMPALGESVTEGTVTRWLKQEGEQVNADEPLLEVSTDKVDTEIPSPASGILQRIIVQEDETVDVGTELALIGDGDGSGGGGRDQQQPAAPEQPVQEQPAQEQPAQEQSPQEPSEPGQQGGTPYPAAPADVAAPSEQPQEAPAPAPAEQAVPQQVQPQQEQPQAQTAARDVSAATPVTMPALGESVTEGTVTRWLKQEGEQVAPDEPLLEVSTDKVDTEIPAPAGGTLTKILVQEDETVDVGTQLALIGGEPGGSAPAPDVAPQQQAQPAQPSQPPQPAQPAPEPAVSSQPAPQPAAPPVSQEPAAPPVPQEPAAPVMSAAPAPQGGTQPEPGSGDQGSAAYVTPLVRKLANEHGVDLETLQGTGVGGRIRKQDVLDAAAKAKQAAPAAAPAASAPAPAPSGGPVSPASPLRGTTEKMSRLRKVIATRMVESLRVSAQLTTVVEVDLTNVARLRERAKADFEEREGVKLSFLPFMAKATVDALKAHPMLNAGIDTEKGEITYYDAEHLGIAVDTERGLLVPVLRDAGDLSIAGLARKIADLAARTRNNKITPDELTGGTFTLTNTGSRGALFDTPIINQPQVGILGTGAVVKRPVVVEDSNLGETIAVRSMCYLALTYDHRLVDGADAARFLGTAKARLEEGRFESDLGV